MIQPCLPLIQWTVFTHAIHLVLDLIWSSFAIFSICCLLFRCIFLTVWVDSNLLILLSFPRFFRIVCQLYLALLRPAWTLSLCIFHWFYLGDCLLHSAESFLVALFKFLRIQLLLTFELTRFLVTELVFDGHLIVSRPILFWVEKEVHCVNLL